MTKAGLMSFIDGFLQDAGWGVGHPYGRGAFAVHPRHATSVKPRAPSANATAVRSCEHKCVKKEFEILREFADTCRAKRKTRTDRAGCPGFVRTIGATGCGNPGRNLSRSLPQATRVATLMAGWPIEKRSRTERSMPAASRPHCASRKAGSPWS